MKVSELNYTEQFQVFDFLKRLAETVNGQVQKKVKFRKVWINIKNGINIPIAEAEFKDRIIPILIQEKLIGGNDKDEINITYEGIYRVSEYYMMPAETFGVLSRNDLEKYSQSFLSSFYELTLNANIVTMNSLKKRYLPKLGMIPLIQIIDSLEEQGLIVRHEINGDYAISLPQNYE